MIDISQSQNSKIKLTPCRINHSARKQLYHKHVYTDFVCYISIAPEHQFQSTRAHRPPSRAVLHQTKKKEPPMSSDAQVTANRANAQLSTGPVSDTGRAASSQNHLSHGFESTFRILPNEDGPKFNTLVSDFLADWAPGNSIERTLVTNLAEFQWLSERARRLQGQAPRSDRSRSRWRIGSRLQARPRSTGAPAPLSHAVRPRLPPRPYSPDTTPRRPPERTNWVRTRKTAVGSETAHQKHLDRRFALEELREQRAMQKQELEAKKEARAAEREARADQRATQKANRESEVATATIATETAKTQLFEADWEAHAIMNAPIPGVGYTQVQKDVYREVLKQTCKEAA